MSSSGQWAHPKIAATIGVLASCVPVTYIGYVTGLLGGLLFFPVGNLFGLAVLLAGLWFVIWRWRGPRTPTQARVTASIILLVALLFGWAGGVWVDYQFSGPEWDF